MAVHKYIFFISQEGIKTYRVRNNSEYELVIFQGEKIYDAGDVNGFFKWFDRMASIAKDDMIDFCFLSEEKIDSPMFEYFKGEKSFWVKEEIINFCEKNISEKNYEIIIDENTKLVCQMANAFDVKSISKLYLKCIPEFSIQTEEVLDRGTEETSLLCQYFREMLSKV